MILNALLSIVVGGMLGHAVDAGYNGRLAQYINSPESYAIKLFSPEMIAKGKGGWQGEHAGKWMYAAAKAYERTGDPAVLARLTSVADYLVSQDKRYYHRPSPEAMTVDWDTWIMAYLIKGFTEAGVATGDERYLDCAQKIAGFIHWTVFEQGIKIAQTGMHSGMAGCGMLDPLCDLYAQRPVKEVKELIDRCIFELDDTPCLQLITLACKDYDVSLIGNGKIYEMNRCLTGLAKAYQLFGDERLLKACTNAWESIRANHLTTLGGPWGGINYCWEIFNRVAEWAPYECTETCSVMEWMHFSWEMLKITGDGKYASEIEKSSYNALMAARAEDGLRWEYYVRTNGEMTPRGDWACCWSSGMTSLEDLPVYMYDTRKDGIYVNIIGESSYETAVRGKQVKVQQISDYARTGKAEYVINGQGGFTLAIHNPEWATSCKASINGKDVKVKVKNGYITFRRSWKDGDRLTLEFPFEIRTLEKTWEYRNAGPKEHNFPNWYNGFTNHYVTFSAGPLVFATDHADSFEKQNPLSLTREEIGAAKLVIVEGSGVMNASPELHVGGLFLKPIAMMPPFEHGPQWRTTWFQIK